MNADGTIVEGDIAVQTRVVLERIAATLQECGASMADVVKTTVWLGTLDDFAAFNDEYRKHFAAALPARSTVEAKLYRNARVEIEVMAYSPP
jgi:2-iminobutanoate/2-iminopropanoate deaminase